MKTALVLGGTRFFGKRLVEMLLEKGVEVTIATRGKAVDSFGNKVKRLTIDRYDWESMEKAVEGSRWDVVYDQICYAPDDAMDACSVFKGKVDKYIFTSTLSVYVARNEAWREEEVDPYTYPVQMGTRTDFSYGEGKRLAEAVFFQKASFPVVAARFPIVLGTDDYTERLLFHIEHIKNEQSIGMPVPEARMCFISADAAARFLVWAGENEITGPVNVSLSGTVTLHELIGLIEEETGKQAHIVPQTADEKDMSPYGVPGSWYMECSKAEKAGFAFSHLRDWLPALIKHLS
jgi:nucleoside-diphosphate-sugar epimerase